MASVPQSSLNFLIKLQENNHRDWMQEHKKEYQSSEKALKEVYTLILEGLSKTDEIEKLKVFCAFQNKKHTELFSNKQ